jgi:hypothetical protein
MKIRIKGNSIRLRLSKSEVEYFGAHGLLEERTQAGSNDFIYALIASDAPSVRAEFINGKMTVELPQFMAEEWVATGRVGCSGEMDVPGNKKLYILIEKDFKCLDETAEDQSDNYPNPLAEAEKKK